MSPTLRTILYTLVVLGVLLGYLPWQVLRVDAAIGASLQSFLLYLSVVSFLTGGALLFSGAYYLVLRGDGTPLPFDPPKRMVVAGPYSRMQHPMMLGLLLMAFAEALWSYSVTLMCYAVLLTALANLYLTYIEEPGLEKRFGDDYRAYRDAVPRWLPRTVFQSNSHSV
jgi:protein-S-isoprenylcysteine O-methyltransferase Ste14